jgi:LysR family transcriptional regulator, low CO2-responsive transcriptional regulator
VAEIPHLETFALAAETGSFTAAAKQLGLTQAAVSQRIAALEKDLGIALFSRQGGRASLTDAGRTLHDFARRIQTLHDQARQELTGRPIPVAGELSLVASSVPGEYLLPDLLPRFQARHPHVHIKARISDSHDIFAQVKQNHADLGLAGDRSDDPDLVQQRIGHDEMVLVVAPDHAWGGRTNVELKELQTQPLIVRESGSGSRHALEQALDRAGHSLADFRVALELGSNEAINAAVRRGLGVAFLSSLAVRAQGEPLPTVRVGCLDLGRDLYAVHDRRRALPIAARLFLDLLLETGA